MSEQWKNILIDEYWAVDFLEWLRWEDEPRCAHCDSENVNLVMNKEKDDRNQRYLWRCYDCKQQYTVKIGTFMEGSPVPCRKWIHVFWMASQYRPVTARDIEEICEVTYKTALFMLNRIKWALS